MGSDQGVDAKESRDWTNMQRSAAIKKAPTLLSAPVELTGHWGRMKRHSVREVIYRVRASCLDQVRLLSDRQPTRIRIEGRTSRPPAIWLHPDGSSMAWILVDIADHAWIQLAYQFGHELGHVLANSWQPHAKPLPPSHWLEEAIVEGFSLRGLKRLAKTWKRDPPFSNDNDYSDEIIRYRRNILRRYARLAEKQGLRPHSAKWLADHRGEIETGGLIPFGQAASLIILNEYESTPNCIESLGALNRWPGRSSLPLEEYLRQWEASCLELQATPHLPNRLREIFGIVSRRGQYRKRLYSKQR